ncbi:hypothetical protein [Methylobacterium soli]|uniref:Uncharacterized protein n=1 Tax=Methylobacterium soli TaxID=553447 RepID=A0A6L3SWT8_9HYPH|nr:hypothetical protein [Methylobacterium soli]KAB1078380.1 hypothetical protein F6X53_14930 [Methylobacterium soli]GJE43901.1 hypothetical protein AEGHOMDF_3081 [Methylobacterium soli]
MLETEDIPLPAPDKARAYADCALRLEAAAAAAGHGIEVDTWYELPAYGEALEQAYSLGIVDGRLSAAGFDLEAINARPAEQLKAMPPAEVRRYLHALWRCERHTHGYGSPVLDAVRSGALGIAASRLAACCNPAAR